MHTTIDYSTSPAKQFDAVNDVMDYFGDRYETARELMKDIQDRDMFIALCGLAGIIGYPVKAWYEHFHGQGSWK